MKYLSISNKGLVEPEAFMLLGASVKEENSIGMFGSGTKYAVARVLREGLSLRVFSGEDEILLSTEETTFRGETFSVVTVNGTHTSITTSTGKDWTSRDAVREFYSNAVDEGEAEFSIVEGLSPQLNRSTVYIELNDEIADMAENWDQYFLNPSSRVCHSNPLGTIMKSSTPTYYRKGVWIVEDTDHLPLFSYNFNNFNLPESRKVHSTVAANNLLLLLNDCVSDTVLRTIFNSRQEVNINTEWAALAWGASPATRAVLKSLLEEKYKYIGHEQVKNTTPDELSADTFWCSSHVYRALSNAGCVDVELMKLKTKPYTVKPWPLGVKDVLNAELAFLSSRGISFPYDAQMTFGVFTDENLIAAVDSSGEASLVILGPRAFECNARNLRKALVEEWTHAAHGVADFSNAQQHVYLDLICKLLA